MFLMSPQVSAQQIVKPGVSKEMAAMYTTIIKTNSTLVSFIENMLERNGLPKLLRNLALIESGFNQNAVSRANAGGLWQFTVEHAGSYGLSAQNRFDIYKSTQVAGQSLKHLYEKYGNWITVVAAYNCGEGAVDNAMHKTGSDRYEKYYTHLPAETIGHVDKFMTACSVTKELNFLYADYRISTIKKYKKTDVIVKPTSPALATIKINSAFNLRIIAEEIAVDIADLNKWNPNLSKELAERGEASLSLPIDIMPDFLLLKNTILIKSLNQSTTL